ncbi:hypothetical protein C5F48_17495 [Cereibacter changlensis JA139]|uniref:DUF1007 domain-containing protein n=2 Tax=Cereibacter changlensis TaxID=402884 RepID=A0A2T4JR90_9RHOB|nr:DUF1007 family protein [Cereibacter changlensis]PTE20430.1 hypothetical protein C5F48_17495 [Cereibacter changlensis JA139]PZX51233.1 polyphosphate kinase [Cereibacter changlensis]
MLRTITLASALALSAGPVLAHPHVFVDASAAFVFDGDSLTELRITWLYDAFTTLVLYDQLDLDHDRDGKLDAQDLERVAHGETDWPPEYEGDTYLWVGGVKQPLGRPANGVARMVGDRVEVSFDLPLAEARATEGLRASLKLYDPAYYYAYTVVGAAADRCEAQVIPFQPDAAERALQEELNALSQEEMPEDPMIGARFADGIALTCD